MKHSGRSALSYIACSTHIQQIRGRTRGQPGAMAHCTVVPSQNDLNSFFEPLWDPPPELLAVIVEGLGYDPMHQFPCSSFHSCSLSPLIQPRGEVVEVANASVAATCTEGRSHGSGPLLGPDGIEGNRIHVGEQDINSSCVGGPMVVPAVEDYRGWVIWVQRADQLRCPGYRVERRRWAIRLVGNIPEEQSRVIAETSNLLANLSEVREAYRLLAYVGESRRTKDRAAHRVAYRT
jgi:hypothetical protein